MKRLILALTFIAVCVSAFGQKPTKEERKALREQRRAEREERWRIEDSLYWAEQHRIDSLRSIERKREGATAIITTSSMPANESIKTLARSLISAGYIVQVDREFGTINTEPIWGNGASYTLHYVIEEHQQGCQVKCFAYTHGQISAFSMGLGISTGKSIDIRMDYGGHENSTTMIAFRAMHQSLSVLPDAIIEYVKE